MSGAVETPKARSMDRRRRLTYRGVELQTPVAPTQFTIAQIKKAVEDAIAEKADALAASR